MKNVYVLFALLFTLNASFAQIEGTWKLAPMAQALAVGPVQGDYTWWSNSTGDVTTRACLFDDQFVFNSNGSFQNVQDTSTWLEKWQGVADDGCGTPVAPHDGSIAATWTDNGNGTITLTGKGAHLGLSKVTDGGEITDPNAAPTSITYPYVIVADTMTIDIDFGGGFWHFVFWKETSTSVDQVVENMFSFYPNPANNEIQLDSDEQLDEVIIRDITGRIMMTQSNPSQNERINVSNLATGLYIIQVRKGNKISVQKLSIN